MKNLVNARRVNEGVISLRFNTDKYEERRKLENYYDFGYPLTSNTN